MSTKKRYEEDEEDEGTVFPPESAEAEADDAIDEVTDLFGDEVNLDEIE